MKKVIVTLILAAVSTTAQADVLKCWNRYAPRSVRTPLITAKIISNSELAGLTVTVPAGSEGFETNLQADNEDVVGTEIVTGRSPYKGNRAFELNDFRLVLPMDLSNASLIAAQDGRLGMSPGENGVAIGSFDDGGDGAGSHISVRLRCRSYAR